MAFRVNPGPYKKANHSTLKTMLILTAALLVVWVCAVIFSFKLGGPIAEAVAKYNESGAGKKNPIEYMNYGVRAILLMVVGVVTAIACDVVWTLIGHKKDSKTSLVNEIKYNVVHNYSYVSAIIFVLTLPVWTSFYVVVVGVVFAVVICKLVFGGFGKNIFNPAVMARILVGLSFANALAVDPVLTNTAVTKYITSNGLDAVTGSTLTTAFNNTSGWLATSYNSTGSVVLGSIFQGYSMVDLLLGNYFGSMGETFTLVILVLGVVLSVLKVINWRTPAFYLGTVAVSSLVVALVCGFDSPLSYVVYHLSLGGLMFGAVFMITDPVTGPTSNFGKAFIGIFAGMMVMIIRLAGGYPEGVMFSIALANFISPAIDYVCKGKSNSKLVVKYSVSGVSVVLAVVLSAVIGFNANGGKEVYSVNGIDKVQYETITQALVLKEGDSIKDVSYTVKTQAKTVSELSVDQHSPLLNGESPITVQIAGYKLGDSNLKAVYEVVNNNTKVATVYSVKATCSLVKYHGTDTEEAFPDSITSYVLVAINNDGTIYGIGTLTESNTKGYANVVSDVNTVLSGKKASDLTTTDIAYISSSTFSSNLLKAAVAMAYAEFNA